MAEFATYFHPETCLTSVSCDRLEFIGYSYPYYSQVRRALAEALPNYPSLPLRKANYRDYLRVHSHDYLKNLALMATNQPVEKPPKLSFECHHLQYCIPGYLYSLGGMFAAIEAMKQGQLKSAYCFSLGGHHAHVNSGHGYCLLNPLAVTAKYAQSIGFEKVLILDWDIHHGDGTQSIFEHSRNIYCISIHNAVDLYIAKASDLKLGTTTYGESVGHCNIPLLPETFPLTAVKEIELEGQFYYALESLAIFQQSLENLPWTPDLILIFSGYDSHREDCGKGITNWQDHDFKQLTERVIQVAKQANCPILSTHGGGYQLPVTLSAAITHIETLAKC